jgi:tripartite-type tricarboxylate transporter receptor subunit TctC
MGIEEFTRFIREDIAKWDKLIKTVGIKIDH